MSTPDKQTTLSLAAAKSSTSSTSDNRSKSPQPFRYLDLPIELRLLIATQSFPPHPHTPNLLLTCRQIYNETLQTYYDVTTFHYRSFTAPLSIPHFKLSHLKHLHVEADRTLQVRYPHVEGMPESIAREAERGMRLLKRELGVELGEGVLKVSIVRPDAHRQREWTDRPMERFEELKRELEEDDNGEDETDEVFPW